MRAFKIFLIVAILAGFGCGVLALFQMDRFIVISHIRVHLVSGAWKQVVFGASDAGKSISGDDAEAVSGQIFYGPHVFKVAFADGKTAFFTYFLTDAGRNGDVHVYVSHKPGSPILNVRCVTDRRPAILSGTVPDFSGDVEFAKATEANPWMLEGV